MSKEFDDLKKFQRRLFLLGLGKGIFTSLLIGKLYYLQIINKSKFGELSEINRIKIKVLYPERGIIFGQSKKKIAENRNDFQIILLKDKKNQMEEIVNDLRKIVSISEEDIKDFKKNSIRNSLDDYLTIKKNLTWSELEVFSHFSHRFPYLDINKKKVRSYKDNFAYSHVIGYVGYDSQKPSKKKQLPELKVGKTGVEKIYNKILIGQEGWQKVESNSSGKVVRNLNSKNSTSGKNIEVSINSKIQEFAFDKIRDKAGSIVLMDCNSGSIISMVSSPSFDINEFSYGVKNDTWRNLQSDPLNPLLNRTISGLYSPGSTFKLVVGMAILNKKDFDVNQKFFCSGKQSLGNHTFHCWKRKGHGHVDLNKAIKESCDCYFYSLANIISINELASVARKFSFGMKTNIDLVGESKGIMPDENWKKKNKGDSWHLGETYNAVIGQGFTLSTPLQIATMTARIATGKKVRPVIISNKNNEYFEELDFPKDSFDLIKSSMFNVVNEYNGTAFSSKLTNKSIKMAGKTGTSQVRRISLLERESGVLENDELPYKLRDHSIFTGFAPYEKPKYVISVVVEHHGSGSKVAAPIAKEILDFTFERKI